MSRSHQYPLPIPRWPLAGRAVMPASSRFGPTAAFLACAGVVCPAIAQTAPPAAPDPAQTVVVTGNPLQRGELAQPASVLGGDGLLLRRSSTLGQTVDGLPGVSSTGFGPNSGRPVIRGLDGDRVRILDNGGASVDASSLSFDHAVAIDPLAVERVEVLRGPAALLYGGSALGGVVNAIDNRIPRSALGAAAGRAELRLGGAASERSASALVEGGQGMGGLQWHADAFSRRTGDQRVPRFTPVAFDGFGGEALPVADRVRNSAAQAQGGALGASWVGREGFVGLSADTFGNDYGVTVEPDVTIRMKRDRLAAAGRWTGLTGPIPTISFNAVRTHYRHEEVEGDGEVGTTFRSLGSDVRLEAQHAPLGPLSGVMGVQVERLRFSALGEEAFVPGTATRSAALFLLEELRLGAATVTAGWRGERVSVHSEGDAPDAPELRFGAPITRRFTPASAALAVQWPTVAGVTLHGQFSRTERAPAYYELFANGVHLATAAFEAGDPALGVERSRHREVGLAWQGGALRLRTQVFDTRFAHFISLEATGASVGLEGEGDGEGEDAGSVPVFAFRGVQARLRGAEIEARWRWAARPWSVEFNAVADQVRGDNLDTGEPLPRIAPRRLSLTVQAGRGAWRLGAGVRRAQAQSRVPTTDVATPGHTLVQLWSSWTGRLGGLDALGYARLDNATDALAYSATSIGTVRSLSPLAGRALSLGLRLSF